MIIPDLLAKLSREELIDVLVAIERGAPYPDELAPTMQMLATFRFARIATIHHRPVDRVSRVEVRSAELTESGKALLEHLRSDR